MLILSNKVTITESELEFTAIRAQGAGGQNVNKVSSAVHLRFDIQQSNLPEFYKERLLVMSDKRISKDGIIVIKAQQHRSQELNKQDALLRLKELILSAVVQVKSRKATRPTKSSQRKRLDKKTKHSALKKSRQKVDF